MSLAIHNLNPLLKELNDALLLEDAAPVDWIVCGGTALALQDSAPAPSHPPLAEKHRKGTGT